MITFACRHCGAPNSAEDEAVAQLALCYNCGHIATSDPEPPRPPREPPAERRIKPQPPPKEREQSPARPSAVTQGFKFGFGFSVAVAGACLACCCGLGLWVSGSLDPLIWSIRKDLGMKNSLPIVVSADELLQDAVQNRDRSGQKYSDKRLIVIGLAHFGSSLDLGGEEGFVFFELSGKGSVVCAVERSRQLEFMRFFSRDSKVVKLRCRFVGFKDQADGNGKLVILRDGEIEP